MKQRLFMIAAAFAFLTFGSAVVSAQEWGKYEGDDYSMELPSKGWRAVGADQFQYDKSFGYLRIQKKSIAAGASLEDFARDQRERSLMFLPGFVDGRQEQFAGRLKGIVLNYE